MIFPVFLDGVVAGVKKGARHIHFTTKPLAIVQGRIGLGLGQGRSDANLVLALQAGLANLGQPFIQYYSWRGRRDTVARNFLFAALSGKLMR